MVRDGRTARIRKRHWVLRCFDWMGSRSSKLQTPSSKEAPSSKSHSPPGAAWPSCHHRTLTQHEGPVVLEFDAWSFFGIWSLGFGACSPAPATHCKRRKSRPWLAAASPGFATMELVVAIGILGAIMLPLAFSFFHEQKLCRAYYFRAVAMELIDGEMEALAAGEWKNLSPGQQIYAVRGDAARNLPTGQFLLTVESTRLRLQWRPDQLGHGGPVVREINLDSLEQTK